MEGIYSVSTPSTIGDSSMATKKTAGAKKATATKAAAPAKKAAVTKTVVNKSAKTGEFVSKDNAKTHPATTFQQTVTKPDPVVKKATAAQVQTLKKHLSEPRNAAAAKAVAKAATKVAKKTVSPTMKKVDKALNVTNSRSPDIKKAVDVVVKDALSPHLPTHSDAQITALVGKVKPSAKKAAVRASASRAEVRQSAVADARDIFK
jgi:hypothetical protein